MARYSLAADRCGTRESDVGETIRLRASDGFELSAYVARPAGTPKGGLVVI